MINWFVCKQKYDLILIIDVIEHLENPFLFLQQVIKICQKKQKYLLQFQIFIVIGVELNFYLLVDHQLFLKV